jgi:2-polyprenyl-6-methoxyphenol hydroxylase-like FAD-dependent oxidoreductase
MLLALFLGRSKIPVTIIDMSHDLDKGARATHYAAPAMYELNRADVGDDLRTRGFVPNGVCWRKLDGSMIVSLDASVMENDPDRMVCLPLAELQRVLRDRLKEHSCVKMLFDHKVVGLDQNEERAWVDVDTLEGRKRLEADYIVGCDGANSQVRRSLFGDWEFPGKTWDEQIVATNVSSHASSDNLGS